MTILLWLGGMIGVFYGYVKLWGRVSNNAVQVELHIPQQRLLEGDLLEIQIRLVNHSWLPMPYVEVNQPFPQGIVMISGEDLLDHLRILTYLLPKQQLIRKITLQCCERGLHRLEGTELKTSDGFGFSEQRNLVHSKGKILVRPQRIVHPGWKVIYQELMGEKSIRRWYQEDPSRLAGVRPYHVGDPLKRIHWSATARTGEMMVKQFETTSQNQLYLLLNQQFFKYHRSGAMSRLVDFQCRLAASVFDYAEEDGLHYGLYTNGNWQGVRPLRIAPGNKPEHWNRVEEALGRLRNGANLPFATLMEEVRPRTQPGLVQVITAYWDDDIAKALTRWKEDGHTINILFVMEEESGKLPVTDRFNITPITIPKEASP
ncbi:DUF58 domain-containing protein [Marininema halotolerans]|uniref:Uncharacterized conserved protein, DUF58 family, contains vWF domain n=1 Tax=Marininema halotolerans TaxID=1155944 RepID=A0A1I6P7W5_9BACL|nr:DUF58 domain-containing protein [Marininema halotolerans]SFS36282.1 Uncharacterized conserved protein, DUF58 family, contains vWF domain [Marininema halotolerans]